MRNKISPFDTKKQHGRWEPYESLSFQLHGHAVLGGLADGGPVGNALGGDANERTIGLEYLRDGPLFSV